MIRIVTDSSANITQQEAEQLGITVLPLTINFGSESLLDGVDILADEFYDRLANGGVHPTTSQASPDQYETLFADAREKGDQIILMPISQKLSGSHNCAEMVKRQGNYDNVFIVDTLATITLLRIMVLEAKRVAEFMPADEIVSHVEKLHSRIRIGAMVDTLEYLYKGGRVSRAVATVGHLLSVKPILDIDDGAIKLADKALGAKKAISKVADKFLKDDVDYNYPVYFGYADVRERGEQLIDKCIADVELNQKYKQEMLNISPIVGVHTGPNLATVVYVVKEK